MVSYVLTGAELMFEDIYLELDGRPRMDGWLLSCLEFTTLMVKRSSKLQSFLLRGTKISSQTVLAIPHRLELNIKTSLPQK